MSGHGAHNLNLSMIKNIKIKFTVYSNFKIINYQNNKKQQENRSSEYWFLQFLK